MRVWPAVAWKRLASTGLTPLVGREQEVALLRERWAQVKDGLGQVVLLSGEAGIGKSRLVQVLTEQVATEPQAWLTPCQCSPYHQNTALYPLIDLLERVALQFEREESPEQKRRKLEGFVVQYGLPLRRGSAPLCRPPLAPTVRRLCPPDRIARAAEAADPASPPDHPAAHRRPAARALRHGRPALGRSLDAGVPRPSWSIKAPPPASWPCSPFGPTSARPGRGARTSPR